MKIYQIVLDIIRDMLVDGILTTEEINRLPFPLIRLQMLSDDEVIKSFNLVFNKLNNIYADVDSDEVLIKSEDKDEIYELLTTFAAECRKDLYGSDVAIAPEVLKQTVNAISESGKKEKDLTKYEFDGVKLAKNKYIWSVIKNHIDNNPDISSASFSDKVIGRSDPHIGEGKRKNDFEIWKTYDEAIAQHINKNSRRYYVASRGKDYRTNKDLVIQLKDAEICISNQWTNETCLEFISLMKKKGIRTE